MGKGNSVYQLKISLKDIKPPIWRRFQVSGNITLYRLHKIIQVLMDWGNYHLFEFTIDKVSFGKPFEDAPADLQDARRFKLYKVLQEGKKVRYVYDFGDDWMHEIIVEKVIPSDTDLKYAVCLAGKRSGPFEDCGGPWGYSEYLDLLKTPPRKNEDEETKERREWIGDFNPEYFDIEEINEGLKRVK